MQCEQTASQIASELFQTIIVQLAIMQCVMVADENDDVLPILNVIIIDETDEMQM